ncbi:agmatine deiminase [Spiroplasma platyhelix]|uniref:Putative agmatine deiminase n=1 Tax=Spiroplasma platyhelix PALS-1 TaxID=1276218 RepID=A0A846TWJ9_9MOLU|nr:agmatine deiminase [Spiroplasma platyhelix]MBE4704189.1 Agmatine deiminase [Spiroplasma platyhelix PALS-1]NKE38562.1 agmatine deiminase [Spiroplasma platyhelix PALS-1]UJB28773.1 agmatine deiminase [Spiroplasma platyhelix PALS-1]
MSELLETTPKQDEFYAPIESTKHVGTWMLWPHMKDNWYNNRKPARKVFAKIANTIAKYEPVKMIVNQEDYLEARAMLCAKVELIQLKYHDSWARDMAPIYLKNKNDEVRAVNFHFNTWGMQNRKSLEEWNKTWDYTIDDQVSIDMSKNSNVDYYQAPFVLEGGSIHTDGDGTLYTTEQCLLNEERNPELNKDQIENYLKEYLNVEKVIWIPHGTYHDETKGHVDNLIHIVEPGHILLNWTDDENDPQYEISIEAYNFLTNTTDAKGRKIKITRLHQPTPVTIKKEEENQDASVRFPTRVEGFRMPATYVNFYIINQAILLPIYNDEKWDQNAIDILKECYGNRKIIPIYTRPLLLGGGNLHCITQQEL